VISTPHTTPICASLFGAILALGSVDAVADTRLHCSLQQGDTATQTEVAPTDDPYRVVALRINRFRFKAVVVGDAQRIDYVKLYTYYESGKRAPDVRLLHVARYLAPQPQGGTEAASLTGAVYLYEPTLGREFSYDCVLRGSHA
jgi:hypothetical protein